MHRKQSRIQKVDMSGFQVCLWCRKQQPATAAGVLSQLLCRTFGPARSSDGRNSAIPANTDIKPLNQGLLNSVEVSAFMYLLALCSAACLICSGLEKLKQNATLDMPIHFCFHLSGIQAPLPQNDPAQGWETFLTSLLCPCWGRDKSSTSNPSQS